MHSTKSTMDNAPFSCSNESSIKIETWGPYGYARYCMRGNFKHGKWEAWEKQKLVITGQYSNGMHSGTWTWFNKDGTIDRVQNY